MQVLESELSFFFFFPLKYAAFPEEGREKRKKKREKKSELKKKVLSV